MRIEPTPAAMPEPQLNLFAAELTPTADTVAALPKRRLHVGNHILEFTLKRSNRRSIGFIIDDAGLRVTAPRWVTVGEIDNAIREKQHWILTKLAERRERAARSRPAAMQWIDGATLSYLGNPLTLRLRPLQDKVIHLDDASAELIICLPANSSEQQLKDRVQAWLQVEARRVFGERLPLYAARLGVSYHSYTLSSATRQWGSCTADGRIRLNWRLIHFSLPLIDYVVAHELSHLREMNHGPQFWATVQSIFPEFEAARKMLRQQAPATLPPG